MWLLLLDLLGEKILEILNFVDFKLDLFQVVCLSVQNRYTEAEIRIKEEKRKLTNVKIYFDASMKEEKETIEDNRQ